MRRTVEARKLGLPDTGHAQNRTFRLTVGDLGRSLV